MVYFQEEERWGGRCGDDRINTKIWHQFFKSHDINWNMCIVVWIEEISICLLENDFVTTDWPNYLNIHLVAKLSMLFLSNSKVENVLYMPFRYVNYILKYFQN